MKDGTKTILGLRFGLIAILVVILKLHANQVIIRIVGSLENLKT